MNRCEVYQADLSAMLDGEMEPRATMAALDHMVDCASCRTFYRQARALDGALEAMAEGDFEGAAPGELWEKISRASGLTAWWRGGVKFQLAAAAVVGLLIAAAVWMVPLAERIPSSPADRAADWEDLVVGGRAGEMTDGRFLVLAKELLQAAPRYRREIVQLMSQVESAHLEERTTQESPSSSESRVVSGDGGWDGFEGEAARSGIQLQLW